MLDKIVNALDGVYEQMEQLKKSGYQGRCLRVFIIKTCNSRCKRTVPDSETHYPDDRRHDAAKAG